MLEQRIIHKKRCYIHMNGFNPPSCMLKYNNSLQWLAIGLPRITNYQKKDLNRRKRRV